MINLSIQRIWRKVVQYVTITEPVLGGAPTLDAVTDEGDALPAGIANVATKQLADRTEFLKWRHQSSTPVRRNAIQACKLDNDGIPVFAVVNGSPVAANIVANGSTPLILNFSGGFDEYGPVDYYARIIANEAITPETGSGAENLFAIYDTTTATVDFESFIGNYFHGINPPAPASYAFWFDPSSATMYQSTGSAWVQVYAIYLGVVDYGAITADLQDPGKDITGGLVPTGTVLAFAGDVSNVPQGFLVCDGSAISRAVYRKLFYMLGVAYGAGDLSTTFNIPDLRGRFIRGFDAGAGNDPGRVLGSYQADGVGPHDHYFLDNMVISDAGSPQWQMDNYVSTHGTDHTDNSPPRTDTAGDTIIAETRPKNVALQYIIKY